MGVKRKVKRQQKKAEENGADLGAKTLPVQAALMLAVTIKFDDKTKEPVSISVDKGTLYALAASEKDMETPVYQEQQALLKDKYLLLSPMILRAGLDAYARQVKDEANAPKLEVVKS